MALPRFATFAVRLLLLLGALLAPVPGLETAAWLDVFPELDPYEYNSFPVHAAHEVYHLTTALEDALGQAEARGTLDRFGYPAGVHGR